MTDNNRRRSSMFDRELILPALWASVRKLNPRHQLHNPVMFVVEVGAMITGVITTRDVLLHSAAIVHGFGFRAWLHCVRALLTHRRTTFLELVWQA